MPVSELHSVRLNGEGIPTSPSALAVAPPDDLDPRLVEDIARRLRGWYHDVEWLGAGRSGVVVRGRAARDSTDWVAIKLPYPGLGAASGALQRYLREAQVGSRLEHPGIAAIRPVTAGGTIAWFEMPFLGGNRLDRFMRNERSLTAARALQILREVADALDHAATQGVAHGALRPSEIYFLPDGRCVVTGFMLDLRAPAATDGPLAPSALGDPAYMSPEQRAGDPDLGAATDQYALAVLAAELLGGRERVTRNRNGGMPLVVPLGITREHPLRPGLGLHVNDALLRALSPRPTLRFENCRAFVEALGHAHPGAHVPEAHAVPTVHQPRHRWWHLATILALLGLAAALVMR
jgi:serine/threonine-protein kinase